MDGDPRFALERLAGAQQAIDLDWSVTHWGVAQQGRQALIVDMAPVAAAVYAAAQSVKTSTFDYSLASYGGVVLKWIETPGVEKAMAGHLKEVGLPPSEVEAVIAYWKADPTYTGSEATLGAELEQSARTLYAIAQRLEASALV